MGGVLGDVGVGFGCFFLSIGPRSDVLMVFIVRPLVPELTLLPLHVMFGNESEDDRIMENIRRSVVCLSRCRISIRWSNASFVSLSLWL